MKLLITGLILFLSTVTFAKMTWNYKNYPVCSDSVENELYAVNSIFCESVKNFSNGDFCSQTSCLLNSQISHCNESVQKSVSKLNILLKQGSKASNELYDAHNRYCSKAVTSNRKAEAADKYVKAHDLELSQLQPYEGFFNLSDLPQFPLPSIKKSVYKLEISPHIHGTAFAVSSDILLTNVHNIKRCLMDHGYIKLGYDGSKGPLDCKSLVLVLPNTEKITGIKLLASNPHKLNDKKMWDFAVLKVEGLNAKPLQLSSTEKKSSELAYAVGFPGKTLRSKISIKKKLNDFKLLFKELFEFRDRFRALKLNEITVQNIWEFWLKDGFSKLQPYVQFSEFLSGSLIGFTWNPLELNKNETKDNYLNNLKKHIQKFFEDSVALSNISQKAYFNSISNYPESDGVIKISKALFYKNAENGLKIFKGDITQGSSGSPLIDSKNGSVLGILFQARPLDLEFYNEFCIIDAVRTNWESMGTKYCPELGFVAVSSLTILKKMSDWGITIK